MTVIDRSVIGTKTEVLEFEVEKGAIRAFATALGAKNQLFHDEAYAKEQGYKSIIAPPTFPATFRLPKPGINVELARTLHGEQEFIYERPIVAGDVLRCHAELVDIYEREGSKGTMTFFVVETRGEDQDTNLVYTAKTTIIYR